ncbi:hypothetical protein [Spongiivirga citrea]|uniref:Late embryogenesis abundant protein LEA-2 subgroup domain-containing protein n=1 Tax=Spongiivirga citrea TaxID=1481457 RepID=A0A6M0CFK4_9FLAO|nr:hypothetical protein [Spongiivirga citrea]NER15653.1 hypothetical protein [Spongiivirga citrea]
MKTKLTTLLLVLVIFIGCTVNEKPEFIAVDNIEVVSVSSDTLTIKADAYFNNPNDLGGTLKTDGIDVIIANVNVATVQTEAFDVPGKRQFAIPLVAKVATNDVFKKNKDNLIGGLLTTLLTKKIKVQYKGAIAYKALGLSYDYPIDITEEVNIE